VQLLRPPQALGRRSTQAGLRRSGGDNAREETARACSAGLGRIRRSGGGGVGV
jgi:hypothetical protein